jgi:hypothetical protein
VFFTQEVESVDDPSRRAGTPNRRTPWLALIIAMVALVVIGSLVPAVLYVVSIDRAVNKNLQHSSDQLPAETPTTNGEKVRPATSWTRRKVAAR